MCDFYASPHGRMEGFHDVVCPGFFVSQNRIVSLYGGPMLDLVTESVVSVQFSDSRHSIWTSCLKKALQNVSSRQERQRH